MNTGQYWKNRLPFLFLQLLGMAALSAFLLVSGSGGDTAAFLLLVWCTALGIGMAASFFYKKRRMEKLLSTVEGLQNRCLAAEVVKKPAGAEEQVWYEVLRLAEKSMLEQLHLVHQERKEYKEYIEQWIHEIKTPITAMQLLCENYPAAVRRELLGELEKVSRYTEQTLYYARSGHTEKDYSVRKIQAEKVIHQAIRDNQYLLLQNQVAVEVEESSCIVFSDEKWLRFILNQLLVNAVKYKGENPKICISVKEEKDKIHLFVRDNGIGIPKEDLPRIFDKGFTGQNGRRVSSSTGLGLYLCKRLCEKLGMEIQVQPQETGTSFVLSFLRNDFIYQVQEK